jgi:hypothetical protein
MCQIKKYNSCYQKLTPLAAPSNGRICDRWLFQIAGSNPAAGKDVCLL